MRWHQAAQDLEDPEIAADADAEHLERAVPLRHQQPGASTSGSGDGRLSHHPHHRQRHSRATTAAASDSGSSTSSSSTFRGGRHGLIPPAPPWAAVIREIERDRMSSGGGEVGGFAHDASNHSPATASSSMKSNVENGELDEEDEEDEEEEGAEAEDALESAKLLLAGGIAGAVSKTATAPLARLTILYQVQGMTAAASGGTAATAAVASSSAAASAAVSPIAGLPLRQALRAVVEREGVASLWRGNLVTVLHRLPYSAVNFWAYERLSEAWIAAEDKRKESSGGGGNGGNGENGENEDETPLTSTTNSDTARRLACGGAAGMAACTLAYPLDLVRTRLAASSAPAFSSGSASGGSGGGPSTSNKSRAFQPAPAPRLSVARTLGDVVRADGPRGLYRGLGATLAQVGPSLALNYTAYGALRAKWMSGKEPGEPPTIMMSLVCGAAAGLISSTATFPLDLVRRRMQLGGASAVSPGPPAAAGSSGSPPGIDGIKSVKPPRPTYAGVVRDVLARAGPAGFYAGIMPEYYKVAPGVAIGFCTYEACRELLGVSPSLAFR